MARPGVGTEKIIEVIRELEAAGREPTATSVRERLGSGSYTTIAAVLADWRREKASETRAQIPEPPDAVRQLFTQLWAEAWKAALNQSESTASGGETPTGSAVPGVDLRRPPSRKAPRDMRTAMSGGAESIPREVDPPGCGMRERPEPAAPR